MCAVNLCNDLHGISENNDLWLIPFPLPSRNHLQRAYIWVKILQSWQLFIHWMSCEIMHTLFAHKNTQWIIFWFLLLQILPRPVKGHVKFMRSLYVHHMCSKCYHHQLLIFQSSPLKPLVNSNQTCLELSL